MATTVDAWGTAILMVRTAKGRPGEDSDGVSQRLGHERMRRRQRENTGATSQA